MALAALLLSACASVDEAPIVPPALSTPSTPSTSSTSAASVPQQCPVCTVCPKCPELPTTVVPPPTAKPMQRAPWSALPGWAEDDLTAAWPAFLNSCRALASKPQWLLWRAACEEAKTLPVNNAALRRFFESRFAPYQMTNPDATSNGLVTGYYEPLLRGSRQRTAQFAQPVLGVPPDLLTIELADLLPDLKNMRLRGRLQGNKIVPYYSRAEIIAREPAYAERVLLWVDDAVELFFLQIQGSGRVQLPDGSMVRIGYADQNGHPYQSVGRVLIDRGEIAAEQASMQGIQAWARANPAKLDGVLNANPSYVFFREVTGSKAADGPAGALGVPLFAGRSIAVDPRIVPLGAPIFLATTQPNSAEPLRRLVLAQDTGGAIRGAVRADFFWGFGPDAGQLAGRMKQQGQMWAVLPPGVAP